MLHVYTIIQYPFGIHSYITQQKYNIQQNLFIDARVPMEHDFHSKVIYKFLYRDVCIIREYTCRDSWKHIIYAHTNSIFRCSLARINDFLYYRIMYTLFHSIYTDDDVNEWSRFLLKVFRRKCWSKIQFVFFSQLTFHLESDSDSIDHFEFWILKLCSFVQNYLKCSMN